MISSLLRPVISRLPSPASSAPEVAGAEPAVAGQRLGRRLGRAPVAGEDLRAAQQDLPVLAGEAQLDPGQRPAHAAGPPRAVVGVRDVEPGLGAAVALERVRPEPRARRARPARPTAARSRRPPGAARTGRRRRCPPRRRRRSYIAGTANSTVARCSRDRVAQRRRVEAAEHDRARAGQQAEVHAAQPVLVRERQRVDEDVVRAPAPRQHRRRGSRRGRWRG